MTTGSEFTFGVTAHGLLCFIRERDNVLMSHKFGEALVPVDSEIKLKLQAHPVETALAKAAGKRGNPTTAERA